MADTVLRSNVRLGRHARGVLRIAPLPLVLLAVLVFALMVGTVAIPPSTVVAILLHKAGVDAGRITWSTATESIIWQIRLPRVLGVALVGGSLALAGALFQAVLRNPLADPYVIGTSAGAQVGVTAVFILPIQFSVGGFGATQVAAFAGALLTVLFVYWLARVGGTVPVVTLILAGFVVSSFLISTTTFLTFLGPNIGDRLTQVLDWTLGGVQIDAWNQLAVTAPLVLAGATLAMFLAHPLNLILLGESQATHLGLRVERLKLGAIALAAFLTALAVTLAGVVAFVGLVVPHAMRLIYGPEHRTLLPASCLAGATFAVLCDMVARVVVAPTEVPLGVITAMLGAPFFLYLLRRSRRDYGV